MNLKRLLALLLVVAMIVCAGCSAATPTNGTTLPPSTTTTTTATTTAAPAVSSIRPLLYRVSDSAGHQAYLFGSIHVGRENFYPLPNYVTDAFHQADKLAVEFDVIAFQNDIAAQTKHLSKLMYLDGTTIKDHIAEDLYNEAVAIMTEKGEYLSLLDYYYPAIWASSIENYTVPEGATDLGVDTTLIQMAYDSDKPVVNVESAELQYGMLAGFSAPLQEMMLESAVEAYQNDGTQAIEEMLDLWAAGDADRFRAYLATEDDAITTPEEQALYEEYNKAMMTDRDAGMVTFVKDALASGDTFFVCVGAAHVMGQNGILDQLKADGYTITQVQ